MISYLHCSVCGKQVSSGFEHVPVPGFECIVVRAWIQCPECIEQESANTKADTEKRDYFRNRDE
mgnify:CR=1 FL=1